VPRTDPHHHSIREAALARARIPGPRCTAATAITAVWAAALTAFAPSAHATTVITVAQNGTGEYTSVQAAINAVPAGGSPYVISVGAGTYNEVINVPASKPNLTIEGATGNAQNVVIAYGNAAWMTNSSGTPLGTAGSATATIAASDVIIENLTIANTYNPAAHPEGYSQAVALNAEGDKMIFKNDRFLGLQDTLLAWEPTPSYRYRQLYENSFIEGNVDFIFGDADAVFYADNIKLEDHGATTGGVNGFMAAPATDSSNTYGFLVDDCTVSSTAAAATFYLGRPWHPYAGADPQIVIRNSYLPAQIKSDPWTTMSGYSFTTGRYYEYDNSGTGSGTGSGRPQLTATQAAGYTPHTYLTGSDGWNPLG
jgi:pectin methylesterase-like acyl-CoA thioesterase